MIGHLFYLYSPFMSLQKDYGRVTASYLPHWLVLASALFLDFHMPTLEWSLAKPVWISPEFSWSALLGLALPLFVISMASQYLPGIAMIKSYGYKPHVNQLIGWTGLTQVVLAPLDVTALILLR